MATIYDWTKEGMIPRQVDVRGGVNILLDSSSERRACLEIVRRTKAGHLKKMLVLLNTDEMQFLRKGLRFAVLPPGPPTEWVVREGDAHRRGCWPWNNPPRAASPSEHRPRTGSAGSAPSTPPGS